MAEETKKTTTTVSRREQILNAALVPDAEGRVNDTQMKNALWRMKRELRGTDDAIFFNPDLIRPAGRSLLKELGWKKVEKTNLWERVKK